MSETVPATLVYFEPPKDGSHPYQIIGIDPAERKPTSNFGEEHKEVQIENVRGKESSYSLTPQGSNTSRIPLHTNSLQIMRR